MPEAPYLSVEQRLLILAEAIMSQKFEPDRDRIRNLLVEAAETIVQLRNLTATSR
jgi:hypothetical protein